MNHELIGQWFPLCGTVLDHQMTQTVGFDIIQLLVVCLLTAFCGMPRKEKHNKIEVFVFCFFTYCTYDSYQGTVLCDTLPSNTLLGTTFGMKKKCRWNNEWKFSSQTCTVAE